MFKISDFLTNSQLHRLPGYTLLVECYSLLARLLELFYKPLCKKGRRLLQFWMHSVRPGSCSIELLTNGRL